MQPHDNDLWQGGSWERPSRPLTPPPSLQHPQLWRPRPARPRRRRIWKGVLVFTLLAVLLTAGTLALQTLLPLLNAPQVILPGDDSSGYSDYYAQPAIDEPPTIPAAPTGEDVSVTLSAPSGQALSYAQIYEKNAPSIVSIESQTRQGYNTGTGVVLTSDGYVITNAHVVAGATEVFVVLQSNDYLEAKLVGFAPQEDLAVLKVEADDLVPAEFGDSDALRAGESVAAIGDPLGYRSTITDGIVSSLNREVDVDGSPMILIQTSAAINFGNSGGALINQYGQVVGITTIKIVSEDGSAEGLGFAIPSTRVKFVVDRLIAGEDIPQTMFGITVLAKTGVVTIHEVDPGSDAQLQGLRQGDIILAAGGNPVHTLQDLSLAKFNLCPGDPVTLTIQRGDEVLDVTIALMDGSS